jgi:broad specificity phosphatase PhoE
MSSETIIDLLRHADSVWTEQARARIAAGQAPLLGGQQNELPLSAVGVQQAQALGKYLINHGLNQPTMVFGSPAVRARQTYEEAYGAHHQLRPYRALDYFQERDWGKLTLQPRAVLEQPRYVEERLREGDNFTPLDGESVAYVGQRMLAGLRYIRRQGPGYYQVYGHQGSIKLLAGEYATTAGLTREQVAAHELALVSVTRLVIDQTGVRLRELGTPTVDLQTLQPL